MHHLDFCRRRTSLGAISQNDQLKNAFPRRLSVTSLPASQAPQTKRPLLVRRHTAFSLPEVQQKQDPKRRASLKKNYSMICFPKELIEKASIPEHPKPKSHDGIDIVLPRVPSVTPEPEAITLASRRDSKPVEEDFTNGAYRPKYCWCMRCQIMYSMYKAGDDRLTMWGNYPCFRR